MKIRKILAVSAAVMAMMAVTGCSNATEETTAAETVKETKSVTEETAASGLSGSISMSGSTSMEKLANAICESFMEKHPDVSVTVEFTGSVILVILPEI